MSYILEALKISEQSREQAANALRPSLLPPMVDIEPEARRPWAAYLAVAALAINATIIVAMLHTPAADPVADDRLPNTFAAAPLPPPAAETRTAPIVTTSPAVAEDSAPPPPPTKPPRTEIVRRAAAAPIVTAEAAPTTAMAATEKPEARVEAPPPADGVPASIQKLVPPLNIAGLIQDDDHNDLVIINDKLLREGDEAAPGLKVEKILADGVLFSFKGYRFKR
jgi:general secretion pathway protein B